MPFRDRDEVNWEISAQETKGESMSRSNSTWEDSELAPIFIQETTADNVMGISSAVMEAISSGAPEAIKQALKKLDKPSALRTLSSAVHEGRTAIMHAASRGNLDVFNAVFKEMESRLNTEELKAALTMIVNRGESLLNAAAEGGSQEVFNTVVKLFDGAILEVTAERLEFGYSVLKSSARCDDLNTFKEVYRILQSELRLDQAMTSKNGHIVGAWAVVLSRTRSYDEMVKTCNGSFKNCIQSPKDYLQVLAVLIVNGANASDKCLIHLVKTVTLDDMKECFINALAWVDNPFISGMKISVALDDAAPKGSEREKRSLLKLMETIDNVLIEILERLPKTLQGFEGGVDGCKKMLEPEPDKSRQSKLDGPLHLALYKQQFTETFCMAPLVFEYLSRQFVAGLPSMMDNEKVLRYLDGIDDPSSDKKLNTWEHLRTDGFVASFKVGRLLQGIGLDASREHDNFTRCKPWEIILGGTVLPGAQFVCLGVLTRPESYYKVPAMRLALDFVVHLGMLSLYSFVVLSVKDEPLTNAEGLLIFYVTAAIIGEITEMYLGIQEYFQDKWNVLDMLSIILLSAGLYIRWWGNYDEDTATGKVFFALSAPLVFSRLLFFAQILRRQGLVIETITIMLGEIFHFGVVMGVILVGFAVSFIALLLENTTTFAYVLVSVFHAMLGEVDVFDEFEFVYRFWATLLIVVYLIIMSIMMLNLLIAVLSTEHAKVDERSESEYSVSKVRMIKLYRRVVDLDLLPPPLNLVQLAIVFPFFLAGSIFDLQNWRIVQHAVGVTIFWAVIGPIVVILGSLLWVVSIPRAIAIAWEGTTFVGYSRLFRVLLCCAIAPFYLFGICGVLLMLWLQSAALGLCDALRRPKGKDTPHDANSTSPESWTSRQDDEASVSKMLRNALNGLDVRDIWDYLKDPTTPTSPAMRREEQYRPATVEQIRYVKNDLDTVKKMLLSPFAAVDVSKTSRVGMKCQVDGSQLEGIVEQVVERNVKEIVSGMEKIAENISKLENDVSMILQRLK